MISISSGLETAIAADIRKPRVKLDVTWTDPFVGTGNTVTSTSENNACGVGSEVKQGYLDQLCNTKTVPSHKYIINDGTWINDGTFWWAPATVESVASNEVGWYSDEISDSSGDFATAPTATIDFGEDRAIQFIRVVGDSVLGQYPVNFTVTVYDSGGISSTPLAEDIVTGNSSVEYVSDFTSDAITDARYILLEIDSWSDSGTVSKITEFFGVITDTFYSDDIISLSLIEEVEYDDATLPLSNASINELSVEFQNIELTRENGDIVTDPFFPDNSSSYLNNSITPNVRIDAYFYFEPYTTEFIKIGTYFTDEWDVSETEFPAFVSARDRLEILRKNNFRLDYVLKDYTLYEIAETLLNNAKVYIPLNDLTWSLSSDLDNYVIPYTWFGEMSYFEALKKIAQAAIGRLYVNRDDEIVIETYLSDQTSGSADVTIAKEECFPPINRPINHQGIRNYIEVPYSKFVPDVWSDIMTSDEIEIGSGKSSVTVTLEWGDDALIEDGFDWSIKDEDGVAMTKSTTIFKAWGATLTAVKTSGTYGTFKINIVGRKLVIVSMKKATAQDEDAKLKKYGTNVLSIPHNLLLQDSSTAQDIADALLQTHKDPRRDISIEISGNPAIEIGDIADIEVYSKNSTYDEFRVMRHEIKYDGGLRSRITGRKTIDYGS